MLQVVSTKSRIELPADVLHEAAESIWNSILELEIQRANAASALFPAVQPLLTAQVTIHGAWQGSVLLACSRAIARKATAIMCKIPPSSISEIALRDTVGELANMLGGNLKSLLPSPSCLSLPVVTESDAGAITGRLAGQVLLCCEGQPLQITLFEQEQHNENIDC